MKKIIHVNQHTVKKNRVTGSRNPVLTVKTYKDNKYAHEVIIHGPCKVVYRPDKPLSCGAHCWIESESEVEIIDPELECNLSGTCLVDCSDQQSESSEPQSLN